MRCDRFAGVLTLATVAVLAMAASVDAATISHSATAPVVDGEDIASLLATPTGADKWWPGSATEFGNPGKTIGQTFTTGTNDVTLNAITFQIRDHTEPTKVFPIRVGTVSGSTFTEIASESATLSDAWGDGAYVTWTLASPVSLSANTTYGVDVGLASSTSPWQTGIPYVHYTGDVYPGGTRFRSGTAGYGVGDTTMDHMSGDRVFHLDMTAAPTTPLVGQLGVLDLDANGGINPATGNPWQAGDQYRLALVTSGSTDATSTDINRYNAFVQITADASSLPLSDVSWKVIGSTSTVDARDNTSTNPTTDGAGVAVFLMDGSTVLANNNADLWNGTPQRSADPLVYWAPCFDEDGVEVTTNPSVFAGTEVNGTARGNGRVLGGSTESPPKVTTGKTSPNRAGRWLVQYNASATSSLPFYGLSDPLTVQEAGGPPPAAAIAGVDFEGSSPSTFDRNPDDLDPTDGIGVSSGTGGSMFDGWTLTRKSDDAHFSGLLRNDGGANSAGATTPDYPARLEGNSTGSWSITIPDGVELDLDRIEFDVRAATGGSGRDGMFNTSLDGDTLLWEDDNLPGRNTGWLHVSVDLSGALYQNLTDQTVSFIWNTNTSGAIDLDTIRVYGVAGAAAAVPEPSTFALAALGLLGLAFCGRPRKR